ncbi:unnamed protein product [Macrosiphum euphorbiae]|uniref:Odorant receptor n=1 Tax=Macrosiphum euphorbiae TaxID=13131 RepID=A0AAV0VLV7_9HEMI|nr:unnamed protein product [Macrosiphum euphorbiae]
MVFKNEPKLMENIQLLKTIGLYQILDSHSTKLFGYNVFKCVAVIEVFILTVTISASVLNMFYFLSEINEATRYFTLCLIASVPIFKLRYIIGYSDTIWNCLHITSVEYLSYEYHSRYIIEVGRKKLKQFLIIFLVLWIAVFIAWILTPFIVQNSYLRVEAENVIYHYRTNILNFVYPATDKLYNGNFIMFYNIELTVTIVWAHSTIIFDILLISMCITIECYLKTIANTFSKLGCVENHFMNNRMPTVRLDETKIINDFKIIIQDQQKVIENMKNIYKVIQPVILLQIAAESSIIILLSIITIMNYFNGFSLASPSNFRFITTILIYILHIYFICNLLNEINEQKDSMNFALYSGDWSGKSLKYKKMILNAMQMNSTDKLKLKVTMSRIVNLELFTSVMRTTYTVISVMSEQCAKKT